jgi:hypothetical protein
MFITCRPQAFSHTSEISLACFSQIQANYKKKNLFKHLLQSDPHGSKNALSISELIHFKLQCKGRFFFAALAKLPKATINFVMSVCLSPCPSVCLSGSFLGTSLFTFLGFL